MARRILIVGTGLIGASAGLALRAAGFDGEIVGTGPTERTLTIAQSMGAIDSWLAREAADAVAATCDVILLAGPVLSILDWMQRLAPVLGEHQLVTDVGSTKVQIAELAAKLYNQPGKARFLPGHPMAGKESGGAALAEARPLPECDVAVHAAGRNVPPRWKRSGAGGWQSSARGRWTSIRRGTTRSARG